MSTNAKARPLSIPVIVRGAIIASFAKLDPRHQVRNPGHVRGAARQRPRRRCSSSRRSSGQGEAPRRVHSRRSRSGSGSRCSSRTSPEAMAEGPRQSAGRRAPQGAARHRGAEARARCPTERHFRPKEAEARSRPPAPTSARDDLVLVEAGEFIPSDGEIADRRRLGRRERDHRRERARHPRGGRRPERGDRRHARALRLARRARSRAIPARPSSTA